MYFHVPKMFDVKRPVDNFKHIELVISAIHGKAEEKACVSLVNNLKIYKWISIVFVFAYCL